KTLGALLPVLADLLCSPDEPGVCCLYAAPLRALVNDTARALEGHLAGMANFAAQAARVRVGVRTGDTPASVRRQLRSAPPHVMLSTPESLAILLSQPSQLGLFRHLRWVIVDEVHALAPTKRGADLALSLERLTHVAASPVQRIGLSATA